jgi:hypothetical protein
MEHIALFLAGWFAAAAGFGVLIGKCIALVARSPENAAGAQILPLRRPAAGGRS